MDSFKFEDPFIYPLSYYKRDIDPLRHYIEDSATYLSKMTGDDYSKTKQYVEEQLKPGGAFELKVPRIKYLERNDFGDREIKQGNILSYIHDTVANNRYLAPNFTTYLRKDEEESVTSIYLAHNGIERDKLKAKEFDAKMSKDKDKEIFYSLGQNNYKTKNNSESGGRLSSYTILFCKTAHSTLASVCRSTSSYANGNNERLLSGNRHYYSPEIVEANITSIINNIDYEQLNKCISYFNLYLPNTDEVMNTIARSTDLYWKIPSATARIRAYVDKLSPSEKAAVVYTGDFYHIAKYNGNIIKDFLTEMTQEVNYEYEDTEEFLKQIPKDYFTLALMLNAEHIKGVRADKDNLIKVGMYYKIGATAKHVAETIVKYGLLFKTLITTNNLPPSMAYFTNSMRRVVIVSDTDSTIFTLQGWVKWFCGDIQLGGVADKIAAVMIFLSSQTVIHILSVMSRNFGIIDKDMGKIEMKNEFKFDVFVPTQAAKHYYALTSVREGNIYSEPDKEIKGVHLKSSKISKYVVSEAERLMIETMTTISENKKVNISNILNTIANIERKIHNSVISGDIDFFQLSKINSSDTYKLPPNKSAYIYHTLWNDVFGPKYGLMPEPPYESIKVSSNKLSPTGMVEWIETIEDIEFKNRLITWMTKYERKLINTFHLPINIVKDNGLPKELLTIVNPRKIIADIMKPHYMFLETLGFYFMDKKYTRLVSDTY